MGTSIPFRNSRMASIRSRSTSTSSYSSATSSQATTVGSEATPVSSQPNSPFFRLPENLRKVVYTYLEDWLLQLCLSLFGLTCRESYKELLVERVRRVRLFFEAANASAAKRHSTLILYNSIREPCRMSNINKLVLVADRMSDLPLPDGLLQLHLTRLEVHLLQPPQDKFKSPASGKADFAYKTLQPVVDAAGRLCKVNIKTIAVLWCVDDQLDVCRRQRLIEGCKVLVLPSFTGDVGGPRTGDSSYARPTYEYAMTSDYKTGKIFLRSETRWKPSANWMRQLTENYKREAPVWPTGKAIKVNDGRTTKSCRTELIYFPLDIYLIYKEGIHRYAMSRT